MANRDKTRSKLKVTSLTVIERKTLLLKYRKLRNEATNQIRTDKKEAVRKRIEKSSNENEIWKVISEITKPNNEVNITLNDGGVVISDEKEVADTLNNYFVDKISKLKKEIATPNIAYCKTFEI